jgi:hypothetical protein
MPLVRGLTKMLLRGGPSYLSLVLAIIGTVSLPAVAAAASAALEVLAHDVFVDAADHRTTFTVTFNQSPDFFTTDAAGQPLHAFQFFYDAEPTDDEVDFAGDDVVIIRGPEIRFDDAIPIRDSLNPSGEEFPNAEGWGEKLGTADYELDGQTLTFTTGWDLLRETDDTFGYRLFAFQQGELTSEFTFITHILIPLPAPLLGAAGMLLLAPFFKSKRS